jgi:zinc/manganese transport system substrate-binding protein
MRTSSRPRATLRRRSRPGTDARSGGRRLIVGVLALLLAILIAACGADAGGTTAGGKILAVGAENQYANVIEQIGGRYVKVSAIESNPNTDPHTFEASPSVAETVAAAGLVVQNGVGYDAFMEKIESDS